MDIKNILLRIRHAMNDEKTCYDEFNVYILYNTLSKIFAGSISSARIETFINDEITYREKKERELSMIEYGDLGRDEVKQFKLGKSFQRKG